MLLVGVQDESYSNHSNHEQAWPNGPLGGAKTPIIVHIRYAQECRGMQSATKETKWSLEVGALVRSATHADTSVRTL
eukprot:5429456-Prymnesium_polylepis.1